jgi:hypothetical protein
MLMLAGILQVSLRLYGRSADVHGTGTAGTHTTVKYMGDYCSSLRAASRLALCPVLQQVTALLSCNILIARCRARESFCQQNLTRNQAKYGSFKAQS